MKLPKIWLTAMAVIFAVLITSLAAFADDKKATAKSSPAASKSTSGVSRGNNTATVSKGPELRSPSIVTPKSSFDVKRSDDTAHAPKQPEAKRPPATETKTIMLPTWPVQVPARVPKNYEERPDNPHAGENVGAAEGLGSGR
jgi:hypothetical protein